MEVKVKLIINWRCCKVSLPSSPQPTSSFWFAKPNSAKTVPTAFASTADTSAVTRTATTGAKASRTSPVTTFTVETVPSLPSKARLGSCVVRRRGCGCGRSSQYFWLTRLMRGEFCGRGCHSWDVRLVRGRWGGEVSTSIVQGGRRWMDLLGGL